MGHLGDVPDQEALASDSDILPSNPSVLEVNGIGEVTAAEVGLGDVTEFGPLSYDPWTPGAVNDPMQSSHLPTGDGGGDTSGGAPATSSGTGSTVSTSAPSVGSFTEEQVNNARAIAKVGKEVGASDRDIQIALMAAIVESNLRNLDYGDRDSIGMFQQRDAWGSRDERLNPESSARMFFTGGHAGQRGLLDIEGRDQMGMGEAAQAVQVSAYPERYAEHESEAASLLSALDQKIVKGGFDGKDPYDTTTIDGETVDYMTAAALEVASKKFGSGFSIMQGGHSHYAASGDTHAGLGVVDIDVPNGDWAGAVAALRKTGFAAWVRNVPGYSQAGSGAHIHAVLIGDKKLSPQAAQQVQSYLNNDNGLAGTAADDGPRDWVNVRFSWDDYVGKADPHERDRETVTRSASRFLGTPFKWGGEDFMGVDNAGFVRGVYKQLGATLPKTTFGLAYAADPIPAEEAQPGDLIAWRLHPETGTDHVGIFMGDGLVISADKAGSVVQLNNLGDVTHAWGVPISGLLRDRARALDATPDPVDPFTRGAPPPRTFHSTPDPAPVKPPSIQHQAPGGGTGGGGSGSHHHPTPDGDGFTY